MNSESKKMHNAVSTGRMASGGKQKQEVRTAGEVEAQYDHMQLERELLVIFIQLHSPAPTSLYRMADNTRRHL